MSYVNLFKEVWPEGDLPDAIVKGLDQSIAGAKLTYEQVRAVCVAHSLEDEYAQKNPKTPLLLKRIRGLKTELAATKVAGVAKDIDVVKENLRRAAESNEAAAEWLRGQIEGSSPAYLLGLLEAGVRYVDYGAEMKVHALDAIGRRLRGKPEGFVNTTPDSVFVEAGRRGITSELVCTVQPARILATKAIRNMEAA